ncbi:CTTNBP2 N-terminal-like protein isoform X1 [Salvelinus namaycush]|uniref:CTTNBP2 N-terminal-like protein isoform X1 n=2 Tax=Salvelinus namaycush TaxID=8040 RepID=A0A8U1F8T3_SALNM|nr:CTTNBP2 N-terminal-like protein isoform X1 [Salvelinus namaycush]
MLEFTKALKRHMKEAQMNMESLSKPELLMLFSVLEGELEARDLVIEALRAQCRDTYVEKRYGKYNLSDPFLALQRDSEALGGQSPGVHQASACSSPLAVLKQVVTHCRRMQEKMLAQLAAAESRHKTVIADLEEERRRHAEDTAEGDDVTCILEKERERLLQQLEFERGQVRRLEKEQKKILEQLEEERVQHKQLSSALAKECKWASQRALEVEHRLAEASRRLEKEQGEILALRAELQKERRRTLQMEARVEERLAEFDTEKEQLRSRLKREEARCCLLQEQVEALRRELQGERGAEEEDERRDSPVDTSGGSPLLRPPPHSSQAEGGEEPKVNGHDCLREDALPDRLGLDNRNENSSPVLLSPALLNQSLSPCSTGSSSLTSSPCSSPQLAKRLDLATSPSYQSSYQAGINQRFHAARHKFQGHTDPEQQQQDGRGGGSLPHSPRDLSPSPECIPVPVPSPAKQLARSTVTHVLSRFTVQQAAKPPPPNSSPFGTDYRNLALTPSSPVIPRASGAALPLGVCSPTIPRADRGNPPPIPSKKPGLAQSPAPSIPGTRASHFPELSGSCGLTSSQENVKELDMVVSSIS